MKKKIYLIEPHSHVEVLYRWVQCLQHTSFEWEIITSDQNYTALCAISNTYSNIRYNKLSFPLALPHEGILIFTSLQTNWKEWNKALNGRHYILTIHNSNTWFHPRKKAAFKDTNYSFLTYSLKYLKSVLNDTYQRKSLLEKASALIPYSPLIKTPIKFSNKTFSPPIIKQSSSQKDLSVLIPLYKSFEYYNLSYLKESLSNYKEKGYDVYVLTNHENRNFIQDEIYQGITFIAHPIPMLQYYELVSKAAIICYPIKPETCFDIYSEMFGKSKYSGWLRDALEFSCSIEAPSEIKLESPDTLQTAEEYARLFEKQLDQLQLL